MSVVTNVAALQRRLSDAALPGTPEHARSSYPDRESSWVLRRRRPWLKRAAVASAALVLLGAAAVALRWRSASVSGSPKPTPAAAAPEAPSRAIVTNVAAPNEPPPIAPAPLVAEAQPAPVAASAPRAAKRASVSKPSAARAPAPPDNCKPPYVLDAQGRKRFKPECF